MASKKGANSNKTAHVLNMIAGASAPRQEDPPTQEVKDEVVPAPATEAPKPQTTAQRPTPPIVEMAKNNDAALSEQIRQALEEELTDGKPAHAAQQPPTMDGGTTADDALTPPDEMERTVMEPSPELTPEVPTTEPAPETFETKSDKKLNEDELDALMEKLRAEADAETPSQEPPAAPAPEPPPQEMPSADSGKKLNEDELDALMAKLRAEADTEAPPQVPSAAPASEPPPQETPSADSGKKLNEDELDALMAKLRAEADAPAQESSAPEAPSSQQATSAPAAQSQNINYVNVMQELVEEKADYYIKLFGVCDCPRCRADVIALTLTKLPAKYVVRPTEEVTPMLTVYAGRYNTAIIAQVMQACQTVMDSPHHTR